MHSPGLSGPSEASGFPADPKGESHVPVQGRMLLFVGFEGDPCQCHSPKCFQVEEKSTSWTLCCGGMPLLMWSS